MSKLLLSCKLCQQRKVDGKLELYQDRVLFTPDDASPATEIAISAVKVQFVNPATSPRAMLKLKTMTDQDFTFLFLMENPHSERDKFKNKLAELMNALRSGTAPASQSTENLAATMERPRVPLSMTEIKARQALIQRDSQLAKLHRELVRSGQLSDEEFWQTRSHLLSGQIAESVQTVGISSELRHDVRPTSTEGADIKYSLTPQDIQSIFLHYPSVKKAFDENVPDKITEKEFWTRCFQSSFFYRDRNVKFKDPIFERAALEDEQMMKQKTFKRVGNFLLDLTEDYDENLDMDVSKDPLVPLIRRFNRHSELVVKSSQGKPSVVNTAELPRHKQVLREVMDIDDLKPPEVPKYIPLNIQDQSIYYDGSSTKDRAKEKQEWSEALDSMRGKMNLLEDTEIQFNSAECQMILESLSGKLDEPEAAVTLPAETMQELATLNLNATEILRHFWASVPRTDEEMKKKFKRMSKVLDSVSERLAKYADTTSVSPLSSLMNAIQATSKIRSSH